MSADSFADPTSADRMELTSPDSAAVAKPEMTPILAWLLGLDRRRAKTALSVVSLVAVTLLLLAILVQPIHLVGAGDYGQWLMASRPFRGLAIPGYRDISALPPVVLAAIAALWSAFGDPMTALRLADCLLVVALVAGFAGAAYVLFRSVLAAILAPLIGLLFFDRFVELFAFGGMLQLAAVAAGLGAFATLVAAEGSADRRWWWRVASVLLLATMALAHVGTTEAMLPAWIGLAAAFAVRTARARGLTAAIREHVPTFSGLAPVGVYWLVVLLPRNATYLANPATAAYRTADSFVTTMLNHDPNAIALGLGLVAVVLGSALELRRRTAGPWLVLAVWAALAWAELGVLLALGVTTDYPRFATVLTPPLLIAAAGGVAMAARVLIGGSASPRVWGPVAAAGLVVACVLAPGAAARASVLQRYYAAPDDVALEQAVASLDAKLGSRSGAVLTSVRVGKWLEGTTGRESLFSQPVRFADRPAEWQRSLDAEVLTNAGGALASPAFLIEYQHEVDAAGFHSLADLVIASNHQGEWDKELATIVRDTFVVDGMGRKHPGSGFVPAGDASAASDTGVASIATSWRDGSGFEMTRTVQVAASGSEMQLVETANGTVTTRLYPADGNKIVSFDAQGPKARVCFLAAGNQQPCLELSLADPSGSIAAIGDGGIWVQGGTAHGIDLTITDLTAGPAITGLEVLSPAKVASSHHLTGAILETPLYGYASALSHLESLGLMLDGTFGPYAVLVPTGSP